MQALGKMLGTLARLKCILVYSLHMDSSVTQIPTEAVLWLCFLAASLVHGATITEELAIEHQILCMLLKMELLEFEVKRKLGKKCVTHGLKVLRSLYLNK